MTYEEARAQRVEHGFSRSQVIKAWTPWVILSVLVFAWGLPQMKDLVAKLNRGEGSAGRFVTDPALFNRLNTSSERLDLMLTRLNEGQGSLGQLLKDKQLYENMNKTVLEFQALLKQIEQDPKKYLNVKVSIF